MKTSLLCGLAIVAGAALAGSASADQYRTVHCRSNNYNYTECSIPGGAYTQAYSVSVQRQESSASCREGRSFGLTNDRSAIWVSEGCEADFNVLVNDGYPPPQPYPYPQPYPQPYPPRGQVINLNCSSSDNHYSLCAVNGYVTSARIIHQISDSACIQGSTWGVQSNGIWVDRGCRASFEVVVDNGFAGPGPGRGDWGRGRGDGRGGRH